MPLVAKPIRNTSGMRSTSAQPHGDFPASVFIRTIIYTLNSLQGQQDKPFRWLGLGSCYEYEALIIIALTHEQQSLIAPFTYG